MSLLVAAAVVGLASSAMAQSSCGSPSSTMTINAPADIPTACSTYSGSIAIATGATQSFDFGGLQGIGGDLVSSNNMTSMMSGSQLRTIGGKFMLTDALALNSITFPQLNSIGAIQWNNVPALSTVTVGSNDLQINDISIVGSQLQDLSGLQVTSARTVSLTSNQRLTGLNWPTRNISGSLSIVQNGLASTGFSARFPMLVSVGLIQIRNVSALDFSSLANASSVNIQSSTFSNLTFPNLTMVGDTGVTIANNSKLTDVEFPLFKQTRGPIVFQNNPAFTGNLSFPALITCSSFAASGSFHAVGLPMINTISGTVTVLSSDNSLDCGPINALEGSKTTAPVSCHSGIQAASTIAATGAAAASATGSKGAASVNSVNLGTASLFGATGLFAVMFGLI